MGKFTHIFGASQEDVQGQVRVPRFDVLVSVVKDCMRSKLYRKDQHLAKHLWDKRGRDRLQCVPNHRPGRLHATEVVGKAHTATLH